jgi:hypothetical protein
MITLKFGSFKEKNANFVDMLEISSREEIADAVICPFLLKLAWLLLQRL